jgi:phage FluMu protein Com
MKCNDCGYNDRDDVCDKCPKCKGDDWIDAPVETPTSIAKRTVRTWFDKSSFGSALDADLKLLEKMIVKVIKEERL